MLTGRSCNHTVHPRSGLAVLVDRDVSSHGVVIPARIVGRDRDRCEVEVEIVHWNVSAMGNGFGR